MAAQGAIAGPGPSLTHQTGVWMATIEGNKLRLHAMLGNYANTQALKTGSVASQRLLFDFDDVKLPQTAFKKVVRGDYDVAELAIVTYLQALAHGKPVLLLPTVVMAFPSHPCLAYNSANGVLRPSDLAGKRIGIRSHSVTTVTWVRGILHNDYGVDLERIHWVAFEDPHVPECVEPSNVTRAPAGKTLTGMLRAGELDAGVVMVSDQQDGLLKPVIPEPSMALHRWRVETQARPLNHVVVLHRDLAKSEPWVGEEVVRLLQQSAALVPDMRGADSIQSGIEELRPSLDLIIHYAYQQALIPRRFAVDELFNM
jgi:4,5-dihydroxyphthalate decarboxylase